MYSLNGWDFCGSRFFLFPPSESRKLYEETAGPMQETSGYATSISGASALVTASPCCVHVWCSIVQNFQTQNKISKDVSTIYVDLLFMFIYLRTSQNQISSDPLDFVPGGYFGTQCQATPTFCRCQVPGGGSLFGSDLSHLDQCHVLAMWLRLLLGLNMLKSMKKNLTCLFSKRSSTLVHTNFI